MRVRTVRPLPGPAISPPDLELGFPRRISSAVGDGWRREGRGKRTRKAKLGGCGRAVRCGAVRVWVRCARVLQIAPRASSYSQAYTSSGWSSSGGLGWTDKNRHRPIDHPSWFGRPPLHYSPLSSSSSKCVEQTCRPAVHADKLKKQPAWVQGAWKDLFGRTKGRRLLLLPSLYSSTTTASFQSKKKKHNLFLSASYCFRRKNRFAG